MKFKQEGYTSIELLVVIFGLAAIIGWVMNIIELIGMTFDPITGMAVGRVIGVFVPPLGAVLGYF